MNKKWMDTVNHHFIVPVATRLQQTSIWHQLICQLQDANRMNTLVNHQQRYFPIFRFGNPELYNDSIFATIASWVGTVDSKPQIHKLLTKLASFLLVSLVGWTLMSPFLQQIRPNIPEQLLALLFSNPAKIDFKCWSTNWKRATMVSGLG